MAKSKEAEVSVDKETVRKVARLARIAMPEEKLEPMAEGLNGILSWIEQLNEVDIEDVGAMTTPVKTAMPQREDKVTDGAIRDKVLANAPRTEDGFFVVPKVVE
jgi:aspartyl-tRNA(Asn)/glutamyl-tRNA(Gln) amidotransferase subunit C